MKTVATFLLKQGGAGGEGQTHYNPGWTPVPGGGRGRDPRRGGHTRH